MCVLGRFLFSFSFPFPFYIPQLLAFFQRSFGLSFPGFPGSLVLSFAEGGEGRGIRERKRGNCWACFLLCFGLGTEMAGALVVLFKISSLRLTSALLSLPSPSSASPSSILALFICINDIFSPFFFDKFHCSIDDLSTFSVPLFFFFTISLRLFSVPGHSAEFFSVVARSLLGLPKEVASPSGAQAEGPLL